MNIASIQDVSLPARPGAIERTSADGCLFTRSEHDFYQDYDWCLNAYPTVGEAVGHLRRQLVNLDQCCRDRKEGATWQRTEVVTNIFLLSCGIIGTMEDYLQGRSYRLPWRLAAIPFSRTLLKWAERTANCWRRRRCRSSRKWKETWDTAFADFSRLVAAEAVDGRQLAHVGRRLAALLPPPIPADLQGQHLNAPSVFRRHDLTHHDVLALGRRLVARFADRKRPLLVVGLRTSGSFLAPLFQAFLRNAGYATVHLVTVRPKQGPSPEEKGRMRRCAAEGFRVVLVDDPPASGETVTAAVNLLRDAGFAPDHIVALLPIHPQSADWSKDLSAITAADVVTISLPQADWYKSRQLEPARVESVLREYFQEQGYRRAHVVPSVVADEINARLGKAVATARGTRMKRVFAVSLEDGQGRTTTRFVLAKSVGWGWLGYHAFVAGRRLARFLPPLLGLREGILYSEWLTPREGQNAAPLTAESRERWIETAADYVAERTRCLHLPQDLSPHLVRDERHRGVAMLAWILRGAYGWKRVGALYASRILARLAAAPCPVPTLIDGRMQTAEWVRHADSFFKTDFEHHGLGKAEVNATDPAYDLAQFILSLGLSAAEEAHFVARYVTRSGDRHVPDRLFLNKLLAGIAARNAAVDGLENPLLAEQQDAFHGQFIAAWNFLTIQSVRHCGRFCQKSAVPCWRSPLVVLDIDGVLDRRLFGFPTTTAAGLEALSLLHSHGFALAMNSARSCLEVREYCQGYGLAGGVAEYGSWIWDAVAGRERVLITDESARQMERLREALAGVPGVFLNDTYRHSIRANTYEGGRPAPIPGLTIKRLLADLALDRLRFHQTSIDTTVVAAEVDKGTGLTALLHWVGLEQADTTAVGDSPPDLPMFRVARRSFAPAQIGCAREARRLGCRIAARPNQSGLLAIARDLVHPDGKRCPHCAVFKRNWPRGDLFFDLLETADKSPWSLLFQALMDPKALRIFVK